MTLPRRWLAIAACLALPLLPGSGAAQSNTGELLASAVRLYEDLQVERAVVMLRQVVSPSSPFEVSREQRVQAYKYLGAALAMLGQQDSAVVYLRAAVERDPFVDMDAQSFSEAERTALALARARTFAVAVRPVAPARFDPRTERATFTALTTHRAMLRVEVRGAGQGVTAADVATLIDEASEGIRELPWNGVLADGRLAPPGRYAVVALGRSGISEQADSTLVWMDVAHAREPLEDSLPALGPADFLPERHATSVAGRDLLRGLAVAGGALLAQVTVADSHLQPAGRYAATAAAAGITAGVWSFIAGQRRRDIPANVRENARRRAAHAQHNADVARRNAIRVAGTVLVLAPAAGAAP